MKNLHIAVVLLPIGWAAEARAGVIVVANRTAREVAFAAAGSPEQVLAAGDLAVLPADAGVTVSFTSGKEQRLLHLDCNMAYFFADRPDGINLHEIGFSGEERPLDRPPIKPDGGLAKPPAIDAIPVRILVDQVEPAQRVVWEARLRKRVAAASAVLEHHCRVRLDVVETATWQSDDAALDFPALLTDFEEKVPRGAVRLTIGFTSRRFTTAAGALHLGGTRLPLHPYILVREWTPTSEPERLEVLLHELGHFLGATHSPEPISVMRPKLGDGRSPARGFRVGYDPLNTLVMNLVAEEHRVRRLRSLAQLTPPTKARLAQIYREVQRAFPDDPTPPKYLSLLGVSTKPPNSTTPDLPRTTAPPAPGSVAGSARAVVEALVKAAAANQALPLPGTPGASAPFRRNSDALTEFYFQQAAIAARRLQAEVMVPAYLIGLSVALDTSSLLRKNPLTGSLWQRIESDAERDVRLKVLGLPTVHGRHDLCQHFVDSAGLAAVGGTTAAEAAGVLKELLDAQEGGSGFSFADLAADLSGVAFARQLMANPDRLSRLAEGAFAVKDFALAPDGLVEGLAYAEFARRFGSVADKRYKDEEALLRKRIAELSGYKKDEKNPTKPAPKSAPPAPEKPAPTEPPTPSQSAPPPTLTPTVGALAALGLASLAGSIYFVWPRPKAPSQLANEWRAVLGGTALALASLGLFGGAYAVWMGDPASVHAPATSDPLNPTEPVWTEAPLDPFRKPSLRLVSVPQAEGGAAIWGSIGRDDRGHIWFGVSALGVPEPSAHLFEYDPASDVATHRGDVLSELRRLGVYRPGERQCEIHSRIVQAPDGYLYFASLDDAGQDAEGARLPKWGSHLWRLRPVDGGWEHLLSAPEGLVAVAAGGPYVYALGYFGHILYRYDRVTGQVRTARVGSVGGHVSRNFLVDHRGHAYVPRVTEIAMGHAVALVEFDGDLREVAATPLSHYTVTTGDDSHGIVAVQPLADRSLAFVTDQGFLYSVAPGAGSSAAAVTPLGNFHPRGTAYVPSLFSPDGRRYIMGMSQPNAHTSRYQWLVYDLEIRQSVVVAADAPADGAGELRDLLLYGCQTRDDAGRFYLGGWHRRGTDCHPVLLQVQLEQ